MANDSFSDGAPSSDSDPYSDTANQKLSYHIDTTNFPKPLPVFGRLFGITEEKATAVIKQHIVHASQLLNRRPTQDEANALAYYAAKQVATYSYAAPVGIAGGLWRAYGTASTFQFPFFQPDLAKIRTDIFPMQRMPILRGLRAVTAWHVARSLAYGTIGKLTAELLIGSYSSAVRTVGEMSDQRLKAYIEAVREVQKKQISGMGQQGGRGPQPQPRQGGSAPIGSRDQQDDASPSGGMFGQADMTPSSGTYDTLPEPQRRNWPQTRPKTPQAPAEDTQAKPFDMFDDASPTGGQGMWETTAPAQSQGSAWERLRRGEKPAAVPPSTPNQGARSQPWMQKQREQGSTVGDSYTFSKSDEERSYAKDEAQKEFDARLERERKGGDFNSGKWK